MLLEARHVPLHNYATGVRARATPLAVDVLDFFDDWKPIDALFQYKSGAPREALEELVAAFLNADLLHRSDRPVRPEEEAMARFDRWNPEAGFFHMATKDVRFIDQRTAQQHLSRQAEEWPMPTPVKRHEGAATVPLDPVDRDSPVARALLERRSWRRFGKGKVARETFSTLLGLTAGVQQGVTVAANQKIPLKTSPSGGARHPVELYAARSAIRPRN